MGSGITMKQLKDDEKAFILQNLPKENLGGFTLVEVIVVTSIIILLSAMVLVNYRSHSGELVLQRAANKLTQDIRRAGEMAMSVKEFQGSIPPGGYGVHFSTSWETYYILYADENNNEKYNVGVDGEVERINLEEGVYIQSISPASLSINFKPPAPTIKLKTEAGEDSTNAQITLSLKSDINKTRVIEVNTAGLINIR